jgi:hypothetical protein
MKDQKFIQKWEKNRKRGKSVYIVACIYVIVMFALLGKWAGMMMTGQTFMESFGIIDLLGGSLIGLIGAFIGNKSWHNREKKYNEIMAQESTEK